MFRANFLIPYEIWQSFRVMCIQRRSTAGAELRRLICEQLTLWRQETTR
jgi:hypothetical protein